jgi:hypothetical protein
MTKEIENLEGKDLFDFLVKNKQTLIAQKKAVTKHADNVPFLFLSNTNKAPFSPSENENEIKVKVVINTTNLMDSHSDVHIPGLWKKSLRENRMLMHLQEHKMSFDKIIADSKDLKAYTQDFDWGSLGFTMPGNTEALIFESKIKKERNPYMFEQYKNGYVRNHSVGMQYVKLFLAINDKDYKEEYETWERYIGEVVNRTDCEKQGFFWAVTEAKVIEGSAVPLGSNTVTPTLENNMKAFEPEQSTQPEINDTQKDEPSLITNLYNFLKTK